MPNTNCSFPLLLNSVFFARTYHVVLNHTYFTGDSAMKTKRRRQQNMLLHSAVRDGNTAATIRLQRRIRKNLAKAAQDRVFPIRAQRAREILTAVSAANCAALASNNSINTSDITAIPAKVSPTPAPTIRRTWFCQMKDLSRTAISKCMASFLKPRTYSRVD